MVCILLQYSVSLSHHVLQTYLHSVVNRIEKRGDFFGLSVVVVVLGVRFCYPEDMKIETCLSGLRCSLESVQGSYYFGNSKTCVAMSIDDISV